MANTQGKNQYTDLGIKPMDRFLHLVNKTETCWIWMGYVSPRGYGRFQLSGSEAAQAHRWIWEQTNGPISAGLVIDHLCRVRNCVNPAHLEPVTNGENIRRGRDARMAQKTHCSHGHEWIDRNIHVLPNGKRECRACRTENAKRYRHRLREEPSSDPTWVAGYTAGYEAALRDSLTKGP